MMMFLFFFFLVFASHPYLLPLKKKIFLHQCMVASLVIALQPSCTMTRGVTVPCACLLPDRETTSTSRFLHTL